MSVLIAACLFFAGLVVGAIVISAHRSRRGSEVRVHDAVDSATTSGIPGYLPGVGASSGAPRLSVVPTRVEAPPGPRRTDVDLDGNVVHLRFRE